MSNNLSHDDDFDGITEENNPLPKWWLVTFYGAIIFSVFYWYFWHVREDKTLVSELEKDKASIQQNQPAQPTGEDVTAKLEAALASPDSLAKGKLVFVTNCQVCHADKGQGLIGPNLTDNYWKNGKGTLADIKSVVDTGVPSKGMPPWGTMLKPEDIINVVAFVKSLHGTNPTGAKAPEGNLVE